MLIDVEIYSPLWVAPFPGLGRGLCKSGGMQLRLNQQVGIPALIKLLQL